jgi:hypothetical protein
MELSDGLVETFIEEAVEVKKEEGFSHEIVSW